LREEREVGRARPKQRSCPSVLLSASIVFAHTPKKNEQGGRDRRKYTLLKMAALAQAAQLRTAKPLSSLQGDLVVASYNLLAPCFVRPVDTRTGCVQEFAAFKWCDDAVLDWRRRRDALATSLRQIAQHCDVICLQEVEFEKDGDKRVPPAWLTDALQGFEIIACKTSILERNAKRNARVVNKDVAVATAVAIGRGWRVAWTGENNGTTNVLVGVEKDGFAPSVAVASVHLDAGSEDKRVQLLGATLAAARARFGGGRNLRVRRLCGNFRRPTPIDAMVTHWLISTQVVVAGDMNAEFNVGSALGAVVSPDDGDAADARRECTVALRRAPDDSELEAWAELRQEARLATQMTLRSGLLGRVPTGATRCGYDHEVAGSTAMRAWSLDHLLYSPATLAPVARWATLEADPKALSEGLPNADWPSDHAPVAASFSVAPPPGSLSEAAQEGLRRVARAEAVDAATFDAVDAEDAAAEIAEKPCKGSGKKNKKKPTPEAIERKRRRRKRKQDFETARAARRASFIEGLAPSDYDALEALILRVEPGADAVEAWATGTRPGWWRIFVSESL
jgi:endonuclease/exonuclease/phosphatase family metal-dependent hydrolase